MSSMINDSTGLPSTVNADSADANQHRYMPSTRLLYWAMRLLVAGVFIWAAMHKVIDPTSFAVSIEKYQLLPDRFIYPLAIVLPWLEIACAIGLLTIPRWRCAAGILIGLMLLVFTTAAGSAWWRGLDVSCGCFSSSATSPSIGPWLFVRNALLLVALTIGIWADWVAVFRREMQT